MLSLNMERTTFSITHRLNIAARADWILYLEQGKLAEAGTHDELMRLQGRYARLYRLQTVDNQPIAEEAHAVSA